MDEENNNKNNDSVEGQKKQQLTLEDIAARIGEQTKNQITEVAQMKKEINVMKEIAESVFHIREMLALAALRESRRVEKIEPEEKDTKKPTPKIEVEEVGTFKELLAAITGAVAGLVAGIVAGIATFAKGLAKNLIPARTQVKIRKMWRGITSKIGKFFSFIGKTIDKTIKSLTKPFKLLEAAAAESKLGKLVKAFSKGFEMLVAPIKAGIAPLRVALKEASAVGKVFKSFFKFFQPLGKLLGTYIAPILIGFEVIKDVFRIFSDETTSLSDKIIDVLFAIPKQIGVFFLEIPDLIKDGISKLTAKLFGPENPVTKMLDSFSFVTMWTDTVDAVSDFFKSPVESFKSMVEYVKELIKPAIDWFDNFSFGDFFASMTKSIDDAIAGAIKWIVDFDVDKFIDDALNGMWDFGEKIFKSISDAITSAVKWIGDFDLFGKIEAGIEKIGEIGTGIKDAIVNTFNSVIGFITNFDILGTITTWWEGFKEDPAGGILAIIMAPINMVTDAVSWLMDKLSFSKTQEVMEGEGGALKTIADIILKIATFPAKIIMKTIDFVLGKLGFDSLLSYIPDVGDILSKAGDWISGLLDDAIQWFKDKLSFFGGDSEEKKEKKEMEEMQKMAEKEGIVKKEGYYGFRKNTIDENTLRGMTDNQLGSLAEAYRDDEDLFPVLLAEADRRKMERSKPSVKDPGTIQTALKPEAVVSIEQDYTNPSAVISGTQQGSAAMTQEMVTSQNQLDNTKGSGSGGGSTNVTAANTTVSTSNVTNNSYTSMPMPSSQDNSDQTYIFRATGTSR